MTVYPIDMPMTRQKEPRERAITSEDCDNDDNDDDGAQAERMIWKYRLSHHVSEFRGADSDWRVRLYVALTDQLTAAEWEAVEMETRDSAQEYERVMKEDE